MDKSGFHLSSFNAKIRTRYIKLKRITHVSKNVEYKSTKKPMHLSTLTRILLGIKILLLCCEEIKNFQEAKQQDLENVKLV